jgi:hypothetical protein
MSYSEVRCPECKEHFAAYKKQCECGWKNKTLTESIPEIMIRCAHADCDKRGLNNVNRVNDKEYLCENHWEEWVLKNQHDKFWEIQARRILLTRHYIQEAKDLGISNYEYFKRNCSGWGGLKDKLISQVEGNL